jgi:hypothetical protein
MTKEESLYFRERKMEKNGTETTSWRVCQLQMAKASPPKVINLIAWASATSEITMN